MKYIIIAMVLISVLVVSGCTQTTNNVPFTKDNIQILSFDTLCDSTYGYPEIRPQPIFNINTPQGFDPKANVKCELKIDGTDIHGESMYEYPIESRTPYVYIPRSGTYTFSFSGFHDGRSTHDVSVCCNNVCATRTTQIIQECP
ncbi:hypothetical protein CL614_01980 [archaeon]|nr:hypothetical protein [archaeon]|tara:strand:- start:2533 stop:2964 length:432 start_codon:yes stop_codon:yes gene_type:complete